VNILATLDHLIVGASTLEQGAAFIEDKLGVAMQPGGRHVAMGTHNVLLRLGERVYLEVIAIDPAAPSPPRPRWFGLDDERTQEGLRESPRLLTWAARTQNIDAAARHCMPGPGVVHPMARGDYEWHITIPDDGALVCDGLLPTLIQWRGEAHPADNLEARGCEFVRLRGQHTAPATFEAALASLGLAATLKVTHAERAELAATLRGPRGLCTLTS
jgi:hypothetical protein